ATQSAAGKHKPPCPDAGVSTTRGWTFRDFPPSSRFMCIARSVPLGEPEWRPGERGLYLTHRRLPARPEHGGGNRESPAEATPWPATTRTAAHRLRPCRLRPRNNRAGGRRCTPPSHHRRG